MKKNVLVTSVAFILATTSMTFAQDLNVGGAGADASAGASVETPSVDADASTSTSLDAGATVSSDASSTADTLGSLIASLSGSADVDVSAVTDEASVTIVLLSSYAADAQSEAFDAALEANADAQAELRSKVDGNAAIQAKLAAEGFTSSDVISLQSNAEGSVTVIVDDRS
ncbi:hypothetical protein [Devosia aurantiaca]|uniref:Uncharacterized protein n=1 Tax=Devosia aurantiaca TaxID=2714858 RepID=A0A6M1SCS8_9HYPH|nr:hypothetical protein [Devosia aurantiaca]NGP17507.1 hypothetical protein [Devosia aurantiaca]